MAQTYKRMGPAAMRQQQAAKGMGPGGPSPAQIEAAKRMMNPQVRLGLTRDADAASNDSSSKRCRARVDCRPTYRR